VLALVVLPALVACGRDKDAADSSHPAASLPGALGKPLDQYTPDEFYAFAHSLSFGGGAEKPRTCKGSPDCDLKGGKQTMARVDAVEGQDSLTVRGLPANGVVVIMAKNTGQYQEARYSMRPGDFEYYLVLRPGSDSAHWTMQEVSTAPGGRTMTEVASGTFVPCDHPFKRLKNRANFYTCYGSLVANDSTTRSGLALAEAFTDPIWTSCAMGCCIFN
jgi:hypothetical protein